MEATSTAGLGVAGAWGIAGTLLLLLDAIVRLAPIAAEPLLSGTAGTGALLAYVGSAVFMGYVEGYRGFQLRFSPRAVARARGLRDAAWWVRLLAPLCCMGLVYATRRRLIASWGLVVGIVTMIVLIRWLPQPWRGAVDAGVVVGLSWGSLALLADTARAVLGTTEPVDPEFPAK